MADVRSVFERLDSIEATGQENNKILAQILGILEKQTAPVKNQQKPQTIEKPSASLAQHEIQQKVQQPKLSEKEIFHDFLKRSKKSWRWFGNISEFNKWKALAIFSLVLLLVIGLATSIISTICFRMYSTFTGFENAWMIFGIVYLVYASKTQLTYEVNALASNSSYKYETDRLGMKFPGKEKTVFKVFRWLAIISIIANIICIWAGMGKSHQFLATIMELLFLGSMVFAFFLNLNLYAQYSIVWVEGQNFSTGEKVVFALPPLAQHLVTEEQFKKEMPSLFK